jgi:hypothetical protein
MRKFGKAVLPVLAVVALLVIGAPSSVWASNLPVPEIDPTTGTAALALIAGAVALIRGRRKK